MRDQEEVEDDIKNCLNYLRRLKGNKSEPWVNECINAANNGKDS